MRILARIGVLGLLTLLGACQTLAGLQAPDVNLSGIRLEQVSVFEQQWLVVLRANNPNDRELTLTGLDYELFVNGERLARGLTDDDVTVPARGDTLISTRITTSRMQTLGKLKTLQQEPGAPLDYRIKGSARVKGLPLPLSFDRRGEFHLPDSLPIR